MSFITKRERVFNEYNLFDLPARNEGKLKTYASCTDARAWSHFCSDKTEHLVEIIKRNNETVRPKYVPTDVIVNTLMSVKNAEIRRLRHKIDEFEQMLAAYDQLDLTCDQKCDIANAHAAIKAANKELDEMCLDLDLSGYTEGVDSEAFETGKSRGDEPTRFTDEVEKSKGKETDKTAGNEWIFENEPTAKTETKSNQIGSSCVYDACTSAYDTRIDEMQETIILKDAKMSAMQNTIAFTLARKYGYPCQIHRVYTEDKYILEVHRIPYGKHNVSKRNRKVVFLQHGLLSSSAEWVIMSPGKGLAYILAEAGYDVWMGNARGNTYSRSHVSLKPTSSAFWNFSWHEIGFYDLPAMIDYVIKETGVSKMQYVGFSQGTTAFWVMMSTRPNYNDKISAMQALAPVAYVGNVKSPLVRVIAPFTNSLETVMRLLGQNEMLANGKINEIAGEKLCLEEALTQILCKNLLFLLCGFDETQLNTTMLPVILGHTPAGASTRQLIHFGQLYNSKKFINFNHGWLSNKHIYGTFTPPAYNLSAIRTPVFLHYGDNDWLSAPKDVDKLFKEVGSVIGKYRVPHSKFNHLDFIFAIDAKTLVYDRMIKIMANFI